VALTQVLLLGKLLGQRVRPQQVRVVAEELDRLVELRPVRQLARRADVGDGQLAQLLAVLAERAVQLLQAPDAQLGVGGPVGRVEGAAGRGDRGLASAVVASGASSRTSPVAGLSVG